MNFISVCSGIEAASAAWEPLGWKAAAFSEIEPFPCSLLAHRFPTVPNHGDMTKFSEWPDHAIRLLCGGTPCQSFSVAGLRKGLDDPRGNLMLTYGAIAARYRPDWLVWENVPGVLSSNEGRDFGAFLGLLGFLGYGFAYRVLDAQYFGVAQRRRRVFVVGRLGDWRAAAAVLFERHSLQGHPAPSRQAREGTARAVIKGAAIGRQPHNGPQYGDAIADGSCYTLTTNEIHAVAHSLHGEGFDASEDGTGRGTPLVPVAFAQNQRDEVRMMHVAGALAAEPGAKQQTYIAFSSKDYGGDAAYDLSPTLRSGNHADSHANGGTGPVVAYTIHGTDGTTTVASESSVAQCLRARPPGGIDNSSTTVAMTGMQVRRLTPLECERLQGFPDGWTDVPHRGKPAADGPRYKALGNSWAVPCARWIGERIAMVDGLTS